MTSVFVIVALVSVTLMSVGSLFTLIPIFNRINANDASIQALTMQDIAIYATIENLNINQGTMINTTYDVLDTGSCVIANHGCDSDMTSTAPFTLYVVKIGEVQTTMIELGAFDNPNIFTSFARMSCSTTLNSLIFVGPFVNFGTNDFVRFLLPSQLSKFAFHGANADTFTFREDTQFAQSSYSITYYRDPPTRFEIILKPNSPTASFDECVDNYFTIAPGLRFGFEFINFPTSSFKKKKK